MRPSWSVPVSSSQMRSVSDGGQVEVSGPMAIQEAWAGRYFEDFQLGDIYRAPVGRTVSEADNTWFTLITNNPNQIHFNAEYASRTEFGRPLVNSTLTLAIITGLTVADVSQNGFALGYEEVTMPSPVFAGDTLYAETEVLEVRESRSRPAQGIVTTRTRGLNQRGEVVLQMRRQVMVWRRDAAPRVDAFPLSR